MNTYSDSDLIAKGILKTADLFTDEYVRENIHGSCQSYCDWSEDKVHIFIGFNMDKGTKRWKEFVYLEVDKNSGNATFLDYRLPSGLRMATPKEPVRLA